MRLFNFLTAVKDLPVINNAQTPDNIPDGGYSFADQLCKWCSEHKTMLLILCGIVIIGISIFLTSKILKKISTKTDGKDEK